jgi:hypothetical protein
LINRPGTTAASQATTWILLAGKMQA